MLQSITGKFRNCWAVMRSAEEGQRRYIREELSQARGLLPLLMKRRNGERWSAEERELLLRDLRALSRLSPYLVPLLMPGGVLLLPVLAWWLDHRRHRRKDADGGADRAGKA